jgi:hypothetical protein
MSELPKISSKNKNYHQKTKKNKRTVLWQVQPVKLLTLSPTPTAKKKQY